MKTIFYSKLQLWKKKHKNCHFYFFLLLDFWQSDRAILKKQSETVTNKKRKSKNKTVQHFFFECPHCDDDVVDLQNICRQKRISYDLKNLFTLPCLQPRVELFLKKIIDFDFWFAYFLTVVCFCCFRVFGWAPFSSFC